VNFIRNLIVGAFISILFHSSFVGRLALADANSPSDLGGFTQVADAWQEVRREISSPHQSHAEKSAAVDHLFNVLETVCRTNCDGIAERLRTRDGAGSTIKKTDEATSESPATTAKLEEDLDSPSAAETFLLSGRPEEFASRLQLAIQMLRQIVQLEEEKIFILMTDRDNRPRQIQASAELTTDLHFLFRQGIALARLFQIGYQAAQNGMKLINKNGDNTADLLKAADLRGAFDDAFPKLLKSVDDLGLYYAKLIQAFSALVYHFSPDAYKQIDYFMGQMPKKMSYQQVKEIIETDLGQPLDQLYVDFEREPFSNGSMAQVHRAKLRGRNGELIRVVVKVQKDFVVQELDWNTKTNAIFFDFLEGLTPEDSRWLVRLFTGQARELGQTFRSELNFPAEAERQEEFRTLLGNIAHHHIPKVYRSHVGKRVITVAEVCSAQRIHMVFEGTAACQAPPPSTDKATTETAGPAAAPGETPTPAIETAAQPPQLAPPQVVPPAGDEPLASEGSASTEDSKMGFGELFMKLSRDYGYEMGPQYLQFIRSAIPVAGIAIHLHKLKSNLEKQGRDGNDPDVQHLDQLIHSLTEAFLYQLLYMKRLHADYNWGNVLVDPSYDIHLIDFANTVSTQGIIFRPLVLILAFFKGDAKLIVKKLAQMGSFRDFGKDRNQITHLIQEYLDAKEMAPRTWRGMISDLRAHRQTTKANRKKLQVTGAPTEPTPSKEPESLRARRLAEQAQEQAKKNNAKPSTPNPRAESPLPNKKSDAMADLKSQGLKIGGQLLKMMVSYPYHRTRVSVLRAQLQTKYACERMLNRLR
jgi:predicted unusual protein kinase regulating ubiquinone biosynthesis (AarF/ABC1/UbiB family)